jgi:hypothetical protein
MIKYENPLLTVVERHELVQYKFPDEREWTDSGYSRPLKSWTISEELAAQHGSRVHLQTDTTAYYEVLKRSILRTGSINFNRADFPLFVKSHTASFLVALKLSENHEHQLGTRALN